ncbi:caspase family protein [uncultured Fibrella sp.]|uniref:caspase family protein n=1 Tax=uncultured Fibrella sp. TaxID=1284596 RepID=UPI0035CBE305
MATYLTNRLLPILSLYLGMSVVALPGEAQTVHAILVADTNDPLLYTACKRDMETMHRQFVQVAAAIRYTLSEQVVEGNAFSTKRLDAVIRNLAPAPTDVIFLYYTGHGYNASGRAGRFPVMLLNKAAAVSQQNPGLATIHQALKAKKARLCITLGDCCNQLVRNMRGMVKKTIAPRALTLTNDSLNEAYRTLFLHVKGDALIASSQPPQQAYAHPDSGSFYTRSFDEALELASQYNRQVNWETLLRDTQTRLTRHQATRTRLSIYEVHVAALAPVQPTIDFDLINRYLNELNDTTRPAEYRLALMNRLTSCFVKQARIDTYVNSTPMGQQPIEMVLQRLYSTAGQSQQLNLIERLSEVTADGKQYKRAAIQEVRPDTTARYVADTPKTGPTAPKSALTLTIRTDKGRTAVAYLEGNRLVVEAKANRPCHVRLVYVLADGTKTLLENDFEIKPGQENQYVRMAPDVAFICAAPFGMEYLLAYAADAPFCPLPVTPNSTFYCRNENGYTILVGSISELLKAVTCTKEESEVADDQLQIATRAAY